MNYFLSLDPFTGEEIEAFPLMTSGQIEQALALSHRAFGEWRKESFQARGERFLRLAKLIGERQEELAKWATREMGKPYKEALAEVLKCTTACEYYAKEAGRILKPENSVTDLGKRVEIAYEPMGVVLGIFPWNFPYWQIIRSAVPVVMGGNTMLVKPAPNAPKCGLLLQELFEESGIPEGVIQTIFADEKQISAIIADDRVKACTLTGSEKAGASVASQAAAQIKRSVLELGGSDPFIVMHDADLDAASETAITARFQNNGQSCIASKRFILHQDIASDFLSRLTERISTLKLGNPMDPDVQIGPMARRDLRDKLAAQVDESIKAGARIYYRSDMQVPAQGFFYSPVILTDIPKGCPAYAEELFGPVIAAFTIEDEHGAIQLANDTSFGLGAAVWTKDAERGQRMAERLEAGQVFINGLVKSHAHYPFGGVKRSGFGRELGEWGIREFCHVKTIWK